MAFTFNGFGTKFYGEGDRHPNGSFVTTEWITAVYVPIIPLRSFRLVPTGSGVNVVVFQSQSYAILEKLPISWPQVRRIYAFTACTAAWVIVMGWLFFVKLKIFDGPNAVYFVPPLMAAVGIPFVVVSWLRRKAYRARHVISEPPPLK